MQPLRSLVLAASLACAAQPAAAAEGGSVDQALTEKLNAYVGCINRLSERVYESRARYFSWVNQKKGPTGKERIIYGLYTIYESADCKAGVAKANELEPDDKDLESAASAYAEAVGALEPLLKEADDYYEQENYKDDKMAKGKELHPRLVAAWDAFAAADRRLRDGVETIQDKQAEDKLAEIERTDGKNAVYHVQSLMIDAKRVMRTQSADKPDLARITDAVAAYEAIVKATEAYADANKDSKIGSSFVGDAKSFLVSAKQLLRRVRDKTPYSQGDKMMLNAGSGWMVEGSPPRMMRDYNQLVESYNRGASF
jgi:hypothetical protein